MSLETENILFEGRRWQSWLKIGRDFHYSRSAPNGRNFIKARIHISDKLNLTSSEAFETDSFKVFKAFEISRDEALLYEDE